MSITASDLNKLKVIWVDAGYSGNPLAAWVKAVAAITLEVIARPVAHEFKVVRRRWVVERSIGWLMRYRRLCRNYERRNTNAEAMIWWANTMIMTRRLARIHHPPDPKQYKARWGQATPINPRRHLTPLPTGSKMKSDSSFSRGCAFRR